MSKSNNAIDVKIFNRDLKIACPEQAQTRLLQSAKYVDAKMQEVKQSGVIGTERIAIMAALNIASELMATEPDDQQEAVARLITKIDVVMGKEQTSFKL